MGLAPFSLSRKILTNFNVAQLEVMKNFILSLKNILIGFKVRSKAQKQS
jgi:hypothetical protein